MSTPDRDRLREIRTFPSLVKYLRDELGWPIESDHFDDLHFDWQPEELGIDMKTAAKIEEIRQLRPLAAGQPWGIFFVRFEPGRLPVSALRGVLRAFVRRRRQQGSAARRPTWSLEDLLFICSHEQEAQDAITFVHFAQPAVEGRAARLTSFGWTEDSRNRTVLEFNLPPLRWPADESRAPEWRAQWLKAFDKQKLTDVFFRKYRELFKVLETDLGSQTGDAHWAHDYALQFLNRCMFLYFIQRKRWLGGDPEFLANFWQTYKDTGQAKDGFVSKWLSVLFFEAFNNRYQGRHRHFPRELDEALSMAPFLNGGLFAENDLDHDLDRKDARITDARFEQAFNFFERYNFTIAEDSPLDQEVAVDPEMIGRVYESLVNVSEEADERGDAGIFYTPRTEIDLMCRLALVDNLANHLGAEHKNLLYEAVFAFEPQDKEEANRALAEAGLWPALDQHLRGIAVADPACGSGSFLVGMLHILDDLQQRAEKHLGREEAPYDRRKRIIGQNLFGVDVMEWACHVAELRLWLALIIDAEFSPEQLHVRREPLLPHFSFKVRAGDSLVQEVGGVNLAHRRGSLDIPKAVKDRLRKLQNAKLRFYNNEPDPKLKTESAIRNEEVVIFRELLDYRVKTLEEEAKKLMRIQAQETAQQMSLLTGKKEGPSKQLALAREEREKQIAGLKEEAGQARAEHQALHQLKDVPFVWDIGFAEVMEGETGGFDIVIGNPPYVERHKIRDPLGPLNLPLVQRNKYRAKLGRSVYQAWPRFFAYNPRSDTAARGASAMSDLYIYFYFYGLALLNDKGSFCFISSNSWLDVGYGRDLQEFLLRHGHVKLVIDNQVKRSFVSADVNTVIVLLARPDDRREQGLSRDARFVMFRAPFEEVLSPILFEEVGEACERRSTDEYRVSCVSQKALLEEGCEVTQEDDEGEGGAKKRTRSRGPLIKVARYIGNKWGGRYLRAPDIYHRVRQSGHMVPVGNLATAKLGVTTGANDFFFVRQVGPSRFVSSLGSVESVVCLPKDYVRPVVRTVRECEKMTFGKDDTDWRVVVLPERTEHPGALSYVRQAEKLGIPRRPFFRGVKHWYCLSALPDETIAVPEIVFRRYFFLWNEDRCVLNKNFYGYVPRTISQDLLWALLNCTYSFLQFELHSRKPGAGASGIGVGVANATLVVTPDHLSDSAKRLLERAGRDLRSVSIQDVQDDLQRPERRRIDEVLFDVVELTKGERESVYEALISLVENRAKKAGSM